MELVYWVIDSGVLWLGLLLLFVEEVCGSFG